MGSIARGIRFIVGASMVAGGATLILPFARIAAATFQAAGAGGGVVAGHATADLVPGQQGMINAAVGMHAAGMPQPTGQQPAPGWRIPDDALPAPVTPRGDYSPPHPPERLPAVPTALGAEGPVMNGAYRSTLAVPPPPLLDSQAPPPAVGAALVAVEAPPRPWPEPPPAAAEPPATYVIRDGDDLTGIATRFYGHPAAAAAIWDANRDVIPDPGLLPIGVPLRMPPPWAVPGLPQVAGAAGRVIEPPRGSIGHVPPAPPASESSGWLASAPAAAPAVPPRPVTAGTVRLAPGETLETLAIRFYGDRAAAARIFEANRDRLRSPELVVAGMELRLP